MRRILGFFVCVVISLPALAASLDSISNKDAVSGLKQALTDGSAAVVSLLGKENGFFGNDEATVENYVTRKALDGLYLMIA